MTALKGQPIDAAIAKLGVPHDERMVAGRRVYVWNASHARAGNEFRCQIRVVMDGPVIGAWDYEGQDPACSVFDAKLSR